MGTHTSAQEGNVKPSLLNGVLIVDKPRGWSSHKVVSVLRRMLHQKKIGHAGTLDPQASGVLVMLLGSSTKASSYLMSQNKTYEVSLVWGKSTTTYDLEGDVVESSEKSIEKKDLEKVLPQFLGKQKQKPPMFSAIKVSGKKLYELAREGKSIDIEPRDIVIESIEILDFQFPHATLKVKCSKGTYIRSLVRDLGKVLQVFATCDHIRRTQSGDFLMKHALPLTLETVQSEVEKKIIPLPKILKEVVQIEVDEIEEKKLRQGQCVKKEHIKDAPVCLVVTSLGTEVCFATLRNGCVFPQKEL